MTLTDQPPTGPPAPEPAPAARAVDLVKTYGKGTPSCGPSTG